MAVRQRVDERLTREELKMILFLLTFFSLYSLVHVYVFLKARAAFGFGIKGGSLLIIVMVVMVLAPLAVRVAEQNGFERFARVLAYVGYTWLGCVFLCVSFSLVTELYNGIVSMVCLILRRELGALTISTRNSFLIPLVFSIMIAVYGYFEAQDIRTERIVLRTSKLPQDIGSVKIVQISDVHVGLIMRHGRLRRIIEEVKRANPDILVSTGDLVDGQINRLDGLAELLNDIPARYGKFAVTGNHEFYAGISQALDFTAKAGFTILRDHGISVEGIITVAGVDDPTGTYYGEANNASERSLLSGLPAEKFTLLLKHRPFIEKSSLGLFDLQLSGHVHKGQIFPFSLVTRMYYQNIAGLSEPSHDSHLYVSRGSGTWGPPIRVLAPPEVTIIELVYG